MQSLTSDWILHALSQLAIPLGTALGVAVVLLLARRYILRWLERQAGRSETGLPELLLASLRTVTPLWCVALGLATGLDGAPVPRRVAEWGTSLVAALIILSVTVVTANVATRYLQHIAERKQVGVAVTGLGAGLIKALIFILGGLVVLSTLGIAISPLVAALGVGGIAVGLALRDILSNLFAGIYILGEKPVRIGDFVKLETGQEGYVTDIGWRTTRIRMSPNNTLIVPNGKLAESILTVQDKAGPRLAMGAVGIGNRSEKPRGGSERGL